MGGWLMGVATGVPAAADPEPVLHDCGPRRQALLPLAGVGTMAEDRVARFSQPRDFLCRDVHAESVIVYPGRPRRARGALRVIVNFAEHPAPHRSLRHALRAELVAGETVICASKEANWQAASPSRMVIKVDLATEAARLFEALSRPDPPDLRLTLDVETREP